MIDNRNNTSDKCYTLPKKNFAESLNFLNAFSYKCATLNRLENDRIKNDINRIYKKLSVEKIQNIIDRTSHLLKYACNRNFSGSQNRNKVRAEICNNFVEFKSDVVPGVEGLANHGNTCFINSIVQCLSNTDAFAKYFVLNTYRSDICQRSSRLNAKKFGTNGELTEQLAILLRALWSRIYRPKVLADFVATVEKHGAHFRGHEQHDAQEFLMWLLDKVHEDLNRASCCRYRQIQNSHNRSDELVAAETLENYLRCNASHIQDIFQAQFRSSLKCPNCNSHSNTFDPFLCISVPILQLQTPRTVDVFVIYARCVPQQVQMRFSLSAESSFLDFKRLIAAQTRLPVDVLILVSVNREECIDVLLDDDFIWSLNVNHTLYCVEHDFGTGSSVTTLCPVMNLLWTNIDASSSIYHRFGSVYSACVSRDISSSDLQQLLLTRMKNVLHANVVSHDFQETIQFKLLLNTGDEIFLDVTHPLFSETIDHYLSSQLCDDAFIVLSLVWSDKADITSTFLHTTEEFAVDTSVHDIAEQLSKPVTLEQCLDLYTRAEKLDSSDTWRCPSCLSNQRAEKKFSLWTSPDVLVIHLKRFRQTSSKSGTCKLNMLVKFPLEKLDISRHLVPRNGAAASDRVTTSNHSSGGHTTTWSSLRRSCRSLTRNLTNSSSCPSPSSNATSSTANRSSVYNLYAVCYHHGDNLLSGHYTASCKSAVVDKWFTFDDKSVRAVSCDHDLVSSDAYILFYQLEPHTDHPASTHWSYRIPVNACLQISSSEESLQHINSEEHKSTDAANMSTKPNETNLSESIRLLPDISGEVLDDYISADTSSLTQQTDLIPQSCQTSCSPTTVCNDFVPSCNDGICNGTTESCVDFSTATSCVQSKQTQENKFDVPQLVISSNRRSAGTDCTEQQPGRNDLMAFRAQHHSHFDDADIHIFVSQPQFVNHST